MNIEMTESLSALSVWAGLNLGLMLVLALNTFRWRFKEGVGVGLSDSVGLERAVRAHGNNTEYVPGILFALLLMALLGESPAVIHSCGAVLFAARILHAIGIQQTHTAVPFARASGNIVCWVLFLGVVVRVVMLGIAG